MDINQLWVEKYRPKTLDDILLSDDLRDYTQKLKNKEINLQNIILYGRAGTGKTSLGRIISNSILGAETLVINASEENGIEIVRSKILNFIQTKSFYDGYKVVILEEAEALSYSSSGGKSGSQNALKQMMEDFSENARFIFTTNNIYGLIEPIISRCITFSFNPTYEQCLQRAVFILKSENVRVQLSEKDKFLRLVRENCPDIRKIINLLQKSSISGELKIESLENYTELAKELMNKIIGNIDLFEIRKFIIENENKFKNDYYKLTKMLFELFFEYSKTLDYVKDEMKIKKIALILAESLKDSQYVIDKEINLFATVIKLRDVM